MLRQHSSSSDLSDSDSGDDMQQRSGSLLNSIFGLNPGSLLHKGVRGVAGAWSLSSSDVPPGLGNISNSCYQNSVIQGLASLPSLRNYLAITTSEHQSLTTETTNGALYDMIRKLNDPNSRGQHFWVRGKLKSMSTFQQQDAQEYFSKVLDALDEEVKKASTSKRRFSMSLLEATKGLSDLQVSGENEENPDDKQQGAEVTLAPADEIKVTPNPLDGLLAQRVGCISCGYSEGLSLIPFNCLTVSLGKNYGYDIRECLDEYTTLEYIDGVECAKCTLLKLKNTLTPLVADDPKSPFASKFNAVQEALDEEDFEDKTLIKKLNLAKKNWVQSTKSKQAVIARAPVSLVLHVNRSSFNEMTGMSYKNNAGVSYPPILDLGNWCLGSQPSGSRHPDMSVEEWPKDPKESMLPAPHTEPITNSPFQYKLRAAVTHYGSHGSGHYVCYRPHARVANVEESSEDSEHSVNTNAEKQDTQEEQWWRFSDDTVYAISESEAHQGNVFMLFYERTDKPASSTPEAAIPVMEVTAILEDAPLPPAEITIDPSALINEEAPFVPLPDDEDLFDLSLPEPLVQPAVEKVGPGSPPMERETSPTTYPGVITVETVVHSDFDTEMSEAESEDAPSTQFTSDYESEADPELPPTPKVAPIPIVSPHLMRTAGSSSARGQGSHEALPWVSAT